MSSVSTPATHPDSGNTTFLILCSFLILLMSVGASLFYSGLTRRKSALFMLSLTPFLFSVIFLQWFIWGFSLVFSDSENLSRYIGNLKYAGFPDKFLAGVSTIEASGSAGFDDHEGSGGTESSGGLPLLATALMNGMFCLVTAVLGLGAAAERGRLLPMLVFAPIWATVVYDPVAYWHWNPQGWLARLGTLDYAGGTPVHVVSGATALAYTAVLGPRQGCGSAEFAANYRMSSVTNVALGALLMLLGWIGFNSGTNYDADAQAVVAVFNTLISGAAGALTWLLLDLRFERKYGIAGYCSGLVAGLVCVTPGAGYVPLWSAIVFGVCGAAAANVATKVKYLLSRVFPFVFDDCLDVWAIHCVAGHVGSVFTGIFTSKTIAALSGADIRGGWIDGHYVQLGYQLAGCVTGGAYAFVVSGVLLLIIDRIPGLHLRLSEEAERDGQDEAELGEYAADYIELLPELRPAEYAETEVGVNCEPMLEWEETRSPKRRETPSPIRSETPSSSPLEKLSQGLSENDGTV